jgi:hypothetical protein
VDAGGTPRERRAPGPGEISQPLDLREARGRERCRNLHRGGSNRPLFLRLQHDALVLELRQVARPRRWRRRRGAGSPVNHQVDRIEQRRG